MKVTSVTKLPEYLRNLRRDLERLDKAVQKVNYLAISSSKESESTKHTLEAFKTEVHDTLTALRNDVDLIRARNTELEHKKLVERIKETRETGDMKSDGELFADNHDLDAFYLEFENRFRGSEKEIQDKQKPYITVFKNAKIDPKLPIVDIGCGRGNFSTSSKKNEFKPFGVDLNESMVIRAREQGFEAVNEDAIVWLANQKSNSIGGITGFQLAEHIPFEILLTMIAEAYRCLVPGGILLLETPNPENLSVGAFTFHYDPSHLKPLPPDVMRFAAEFKGFSRTEIMRMQPAMSDEDIKKATSNKALQAALTKLYGPRDYSLVAYK